MANESNLLLKQKSKLDRSQTRDIPSSETEAWHNCERPETAQATQETCRHSLPHLGLSSAPLALRVDLLSKPSRRLASSLNCNCPSNQHNILQTTARKITPTSDACLKQLWRASQLVLSSRPDSTGPPAAVVALSSVVFPLHCSSHLLGRPLPRIPQQHLPRASTFKAYATLPFSLFLRSSSAVRR